ncbi:hypothetical protein GBAR_LOCUS12976 [Geodia barretti]|uniref:Right handed beta helix domain-containing protein n=1 Tax=Geodia barretti TaxID=519541 RepID=A0AA35S4M2_GEOBA|nr:hypothetical protein GBAR_LOCUS12976 [Geodia barretti]
MQALILLIAVASLLPPITSQTCKLLEQSLDPLQKGPDDVTVRRVELNGTDNASCLNANREQDSPPCRTIEFALQPTLNVENRSVTENLTIYVGAGIYRPANQDAIGIIDSRNVQLIGAGVGQTVFWCGLYGEEDTACSYMNFQIRNSKYVYLSNMTFTRCGPITSAVYISSSDYVVVKDCQFRDNISPPLLVHNTSPFVLYRTTFTNNHPQELNESVTSDTCYSSGGVDNFFLDNRTSSGGLSQYSENGPTLLYIERCVFVDNNARPDDTVSLPRQSKGYGHGAAANIRLSNSSNGQVCIKSCEFEDNQAEAQAGAVGLTVGGPSTRNNIELLNCTFFNNSCTLDRCTGGAIGIDFFADTAFNEILIKESEFIRNNARDGMGGAISLSTTVNVVTKDGLSDTLLLEGCLFSQNQAFYDGTAVGVFSLTHTDQVGLPVNITDCHFLNNSATRGSADSTALTAYRVLLTFNGNSSFVNNFGGGMSLLGSRMDVQGEVNLDRNFAVFGAGIAMTGRSLLLLFEGAVLSFTNNVAVDEGAGLYVEYTSADFVLAILNRGCFIQYFSQLIDVPPNEWKATVRFVNNSAGIAGAAIYANDMSRCRWLGPTNYTTFIFNTPSDYKSPFIMENNTLDRSSSKDTRLATDASTFFATTDYGDSPMVGYGETVSFHLNSTDQFSNFRESVWTFKTAYQDQSLGALSTNETVFEYVVPGRGDRDSVNISANFSLIGGQTSVSSVLLQVQGCHPGYMLQEKTQTCVCDFSSSIIVQCDTANRYFYARDGYWVGVKSKSSALIYSTTVPGFLNCTRQGALPGCEIRYDSLEDQCAQGRQGTLCGDCKEGYGVTFDLRFCRRCGAGGIVLFVFICIMTVIVSLLILFYNLPLPDELKGFVFFAQVIGLIYRNAPYLVGQNDSNALFDTLGFSLPFQLCPAENIPAFGIALLGFVPPLLATSVAIIYIFFAKRSKYLSERQSFNGFHFLYVFVYKYFLDTSFIFISCTLLGDNYVFLYQARCSVLSIHLCCCSPLVCCFYWGWE